MKANVKNIIMLLAMVLVVIVAVSLIAGSLNNEEKFTYRDVIKLFDDDLVVEFTVDDNLLLTLKTLTPDPDNEGKYKTNASGEFIYTYYECGLTYNFQLEEINEIAKKRYIRKE